METTQQEVNKWFEETVAAPNAQEYLPSLKLEAGDYTMQCTQPNPRFYDTVEKVKKDGVETERPVTQAIFEVKYGDKLYSFWAKKTGAEGSKYQQLVAIAKKHGGLAGVKIRVIVNGKGLAKRFTIIEA